MNYSSYFLASWICIILGYASCNSQSTLSTDIETLEKYFNASDSNLADGHTVFLKMINHWKEESDKNILMSHIVTVYFNIFKIFENNTTIKKNLDNIKEEMQIRLFPNTTSKMNDFQKIINTPVNDFRVQQKAMHELRYVMNYLNPRSQLRKRKRRQNRPQRAIKQ